MNFIAEWIKQAPKEKDMSTDAAIVESFMAYAKKSNLLSEFNGLKDILRLALYWQGAMGTIFYSTFYALTDIEYYASK